jgi:tetratricopeptide (TPR) repeat protein
MIRNILEQEDVPEEFCKLIYEKTRGNPFFVEEVIKSLREQEVIRREGNKWTFKDVSDIEFPETVKNVVKARFNRLDDDCQSVLMMASFIGNDFTLAAMQAVTSIEEDKLLRLMDRISKTGLIKERIVRREGICSFADILVRDVVYEGVSPLTRQKLHGVVGTALEKIYAKTIDEHLGELASHFLEGGEKDKALDYFLKAGEKAASLYANAEAASYFRSAFVLLESRENRLPEKVHVLENLGSINNRIAEYKTAVKYFREALILWKQLGEKRKAANLLRAIAEIHWGVDGSIERATAHYNEALEILTAEPDCVEFIWLQLSLAGVHFQTGDLEKTMVCAEKALELSRRLGRFDTMARSYSILGATHLNRGEVRKARDYLEKALEISLDNDYPQYALNAFNNLAVTLPAEENERRLECVEKAYELARKAGIVSSISWQGSAAAVVHALMGDAKKALHLAEESVALDMKAGDLFNLSFSNVALGFVKDMLGEWDRSEQCFLQALAGSEKTHAYQAAWISYAGLGELYCDRGEYPRARDFFEKMYGVLEKAKVTMPPVFQMYHTTSYALTLIELGELEKAASIIDLMYESARPTSDKGLFASADTLRAAKLRAEKKWQEAIELFAASVQKFEALEWRKWMPQFFAKVVLDQFARTYLERDQEGDREKALTLLNQALEVFQKTGAKKDIETVEARIARLETGGVTLKPKHVDQVSTGYADLDRLLHEGIPPSHVVALTSPSCDERDMLVRSFLETGAKKGEITFFATNDPSAGKPLAEEFTSNFYLFVCNPEAEAIIKSSPNVHTLKGVENLTDISIALTSTIRELDPSPKGCRRICLDLVSDVLLQHHAVETRRWLAALVTRLKSEGFTTLAVMDPEMHSSQDARAVLDLFDGEINLYERDTEKGVGKFLRIKRMSNHEYLEDELPLKK